MGLTVNDIQFKGVSIEDYQEYCVPHLVQGVEDVAKKLGYTPFYLAISDPRVIPRPYQNARNTLIEAELGDINRAIRQAARDALFEKLHFEKLRMDINPKLPVSILRSEDHYLVLWSYSWSTTLNNQALMVFNDAFHAGMAKLQSLASHGSPLIFVPQRAEAGPVLTIDVPLRFE